LPVLSLSKLTELATIELSAVMLAPRDKQQREHLMAARILDEAIRFRREAATAGDAAAHRAAKLYERLLLSRLEVIRESPPSKTLSEHSGKGEMRAKIAGALFLYMLTLKLNPNPQLKKCATLRKGVFVLSMRNQAGRGYGKTAVMSAWRAFEPVAHLWAARRIKVRPGGFRLGSFLSRAEQLAQRAIDCGIPWSSDEAWRVDRHLVMPPVSFELPSMSSPVIRRILRQYKAS